MENILDHQTPESSQEPDRMEIEQEFCSQYEKEYLEQESIAHENDQDTTSKCKDTEKSKKEEEKKIEEKRNQYITRTSDNGEKKQIFVVNLDEYNADTNVKNLLGKKKHEIKVEKKLEESKKEKVEKKQSNMAVTECSNKKKRKKKNDTNVNNKKNNINIYKEKNADLLINNNYNDENINNLIFDESNFFFDEQNQSFIDECNDKFDSEQFDLSHVISSDNRYNSNSVEEPNANANPTSKFSSLRKHVNNLHL
jgi:hypothetical protein